MPERDESPSPSSSAPSPSSSASPSPSQSSSTPMVFAAGGLLWRDDADERAGPRLAVVHRPRYDDWSLPKGKLEPGELLPEAAVREVEEETGFAVRREGFAGRYQYTVDAGPKTVFVWQMHPVAERGRPDDEVDELAWLRVDEALDRLTYALERDLLGRLVDADDDPE